MATSQRPSKAALLQAFLDDAKKSVPDWLAADSEMAWHQCYPGTVAPRWLDACWLTAQRGVASLRCIQTATRLGIALESDGDRAACRQRLLGLEGTTEGADGRLLAYLRPLRSGQWRQLLAEIAAILPQTNVRGYQAIAAEAARLGWPTHYREDLTEIDLGTLCVPGAPALFWWGIRSTGTDLFRPNALFAVRWAQAQQREQGAGTERLFYVYRGGALKPISLDHLIIQLVRSLDPRSFEQVVYDTAAIEYQAGLVRPQTRAALLAYQEAQGASQRARKELADVKSLKQRYA